MIPHTIHQIWFQGEAAIPPRYRPLRAEVLRMHPKWSYILWDENSIRQLIKETCPWFLSKWEGYPYMIQKVDAAKPVFLWAMGGVYLDLDMSCLRPLDDLVAPPSECLLSRCWLPDWAQKVCQTAGLELFGKTQVNNGFLACTKRHPIAEQMLRMLPTTVAKPKGMNYSLYICQTTGPELLNRAVKAVAAAMGSSLQVTILPYDVIEPCTPWVGEAEPRLTERTYVIHYSKGVWRQLKNRNNTGTSVDDPEHEKHPFVVAAVGVGVAFLVIAALFGILLYVARRRRTLLLEKSTPSL